jgi:hypothetical protein
VLRWVGAFAAVLMLVLLFGIWRLMQGPIALDRLTPYVEAALARSGIGLKIAISGVRIAIDRSTHQLDLRLENVTLALPDGEKLARFPEMATSFGLGQLLRGRLAPTEIVVERPVLHLLRDASGSIRLRIGADTQGAPTLDPQLLERLAGPPERDASLGLLHQISIRGATVTVDDHRAGRAWRADRVDVAVERSAKGARGDVSFAVAIGASRPELHASYRYLAARQLLDLDLTIDGAEPAAIPALIPELAQLHHVEAPVSGTLRTRIDLKAGRAEGSRLDLALGKGLLHSDWLPGGSIAIAKGDLHATYAPESNEVRLQSVTLDLGGGARVHLAGTLTGVTPELLAAPAAARPVGHVRGDLDVTLSNLPAARLGELGPTALSPGGRRWVSANITAGTLDEAAVTLAVDLDPVAHTANVLSDSGRLRYHDLTIAYFKGLPPVREVAGTASFARNHLEFVPTAGTLKGIKVTGGALRLTDLGAPVEWLTIDLALSGPLQDALAVLDTRPLHYAHAVGVDPVHVGGRFDSQLRFKLPLLDSLKLDEVEYGARATIAGASLPKAAFDRDLRDGDLTLEVSGTGAHVHGTAKFDDIPTMIDATRPFHPGTGAHATYRVGMTLDDKARHALGLDVAPDRLSGPIGLDATYSVFAGKRSEATEQLDLRAARLTIPEAGWEKPPGQPGSAKIVLDLDNERIVRVRQVDVTAPGLDARLAASLTADHKSLERVDIRRLAVGGSELSGSVLRRPDGGWQATIRAARLDARNLVKEAMRGAPSAASPPLALDARIDRLVLGPQRELRAVDAALVRSGGAWRSGRIAGSFANGRHIALRFSETGDRKLVLQSDDLGASLKLLDIADNVVGGQLTLAGQFSDAAGKRVLRAQVDGTNYSVTRASLLARLLALPSLTGIASTLSGSGLWFSRLRGDIVFADGRLTLDRLLAFGESLGITASGWVDTTRDRLELQGTVAPTYLLNSLLGNLPIIGKLLGGGSQGLLAANYRLSGSSSDPQVAVNPLSALAPGVLRQLFAPVVGFAAVPQPQQAAQ